MAEMIVLHVGTHKTGTTSLQHFLHDHDGTLLETVGASYPTGFVIPAAHAEIPLIAIRPDRLWPARLRFPETQQGSWLTAAAEHVRAQVRDADREVMVLSHEDLSYVRFDDELERVRELLGARPVRVVVFLRDKASFLLSYRAQIEATGFAVSDDPSSYAYVEPDSWLVDHDDLLAVYRRFFGDGNVEVIDYDATTARDGSVIPAFTDLLGLPRASLPSLERYHVNRSDSQIRLTEEQLATMRRRLAEQAR